MSDYERNSLSHKKQLQFDLSMLIERYKDWEAMESFCSDHDFDECVINIRQEKAIIGRKIASFFTQQEEE
jgi:hypothetical protein